MSFNAIPFLSISRFVTCVQDGREIELIQSNRILYSYVVSTDSNVGLIEIADIYILVI